MPVPSVTGKDRIPIGGERRSDKARNCCEASFPGTIFFFFLLRKTKPHLLTLKEKGAPHSKAKGAKMSHMLHGRQMFAKRESSAL